MTHRGGVVAILPQGTARHRKRYGIVADEYLQNERRRHRARALLRPARTKVGHACPQAEGKATGRTGSPKGHLRHLLLIRKHNSATNTLPVSRVIGSLHAPAFTALQKPNVWCIPLLRDQVNYPTATQPPVNTHTDYFDDLQVQPQPQPQLQP